MASHNALVLFDMSNFIHRSFHSLPVDKFRRNDGLATNAVYGTTKLVLSLLTDFAKQYTHVTPVACFDTAKSKLSRVSIDANYKSTRPSAPNDLKHQFAWVRDLVNSMHISQVELESHEADDIIASLAIQNKDKYDKVIIVSTDKDFNQCMIYSNIIIYNIAKKEYFTSNDVLAKFGVKPEHFVLYQGLVGDKIDNVSGIKGIGAKIAPIIVNQAHGNIETLRNLAENNSVQRNKSKLILDNFDVLTNSCQLVTLDTNLQVGSSFHEFKLKSLKQHDEFKSFLESMNFNSFKKYI